MEAKRFVLRKVAGENILVPVGNTALTFNGLVTLNESGAFLWKHMEKNRTREELVQEVLQEYEVSEEQARLDIGQFLTYLAKAGVLEGGIRKGRIDSGVCCFIWHLWSRLCLPLMQA